MKLRVLLPTDSTIESSDRKHFIELTQGLFGSASIVRSNTVVSLSGSAQDFQGLSTGISNEVDRAILVALRRASDIVVVGGNTARVESYSKPRSTRLAIVSKSGDLAAIPAITDASGPPVIAFLPQPALSQIDGRKHASQIDLRPLADGLSAGGALIEATRALADEGFRSILHESGLPQIKALAAEGILEEINLTITKLPGQTFRPSDVSLRLLDVTNDKYELKVLATSTDAMYMSWRRGNANG